MGKKIAIIDNNPDQRLGSRTHQFRNLISHFEEHSFELYSLCEGSRQISNNLDKIMECDGMILTGSEYNLSEVNDKNSAIAQDLIEKEQNLLDDEIQLVRTFPKPILGICFGHQLLGYVYGNKIIRIPENHKRNVERRVSVKIEIHTRFNLLPPSSYSVNVSHQEEIASENIKIFQYNEAILESSSVNELYLQGLTILGWNPETKVIHAIKDPLKPIYGVQFHPEFDFKDLNNIGNTGVHLFTSFFDQC